MAGSDRFKSIVATDYGEIGGLKVAWLGDWFGALPMEDALLVTG